MNKANCRKYLKEEKNEKLKKLHSNHLWTYKLNAVYHWNSAAESNRRKNRLHLTKKSALAEN